VKERIYVEVLIMAQLSRFGAALVLIMVFGLSVTAVSAQETESCDTSVDYATLATSVYSDKSQKG
jgi:hypothetical protein